MCQSGAGVGQAVEIILALAARGDDSAVPKQRQMMADGGLALAQLGAQGPHVPLAFGQNQDDLKSRRIADVLEQDRCCASLLYRCSGPLRAFGLPAADLGAGALFTLVLTAMLLPSSTN